MKNKAIKIINEILKIEKKDIKAIEPLLGGMSHYTYLVKTTKGFYTVRIIGEGGNLFIDRKEEWENIKLVDELNINNKTLYFDSESGIKIAKFIEGNVLTTFDTRKHLDKVANTFKKLHTSKMRAIKDYGLVKRLNLYESYNDKQEDLYLELKNNWLNLYNKYYKSRRLVFCHNDAQKSNLVLSNDKVYMLDWEYAGNNDFYYDIASFGEHSILLLEAYLERKPKNNEIRDVYFYKMFQSLQWYQVALYKDKINLDKTINFNFYDVATNFIKNAQLMFNKIKDGYDEVK